MARKRVEISSCINSWDDVDTAFKQIIECEGKIDEINVELNRQVSSAKESADAQAKPLTSKIKTLELEIKDYVVKHRDEIQGKTKQLNFGKTGFRLSTSIGGVGKNKIADIIAKIKSLKMTDCITVKESLNKEALKKYPADEILKTGAYLKTTDEFWYETDKESLEA